MIFNRVYQKFKILEEYITTDRTDLFGLHRKYIFYPDPIKGVPGYTLRPNVVWNTTRGKPPYTHD